MWCKSLTRVAGFLAALVAILAITSCGGGNSNNTTGQKSNLKNRVFVSNTFSGRLLIIDDQTDKAAYTTTTTTNSAGQQITVTTPIGISLGGQTTWENVSPNRTYTAAFQSDSNSLIFANNTSETVVGTVALGGAAVMGLFSTDSNTFYVPVPNLVVTGQRNGGIQVISISSFTATTYYAIPSVRGIAVSPTGQYLLGFADSSDSVFVVNLQASPVTVTEVPGFARPVNAFFTSDGTAYVLNCGPECASMAGPPSVSQFNVSTRTITANVPVGGATVGLLDGTTLWVAGNPGPNGSVDAVNISNMTRITANSISIGDGLHTKMQLATNKKLYIGALTCSNITTGCLSVVDATAMAASPALPPNGPITGMLAIPNRNTMYVVQNGYLAIYDTTTNMLQSTQLVFTGQLYDVVQVDP